MNQVKKLLKDYSNWFGMRNDYDCFTQSNLTDAVRREIRNNFQIPMDEDILFFRDTSFWNNKDQGTAITERCMYFIPDNDNPEEGFTIEWTEFEYVEYKDLVFYFCDKDRDIVARLDKGLLMKCDDDVASQKGKLVADLLTKSAETQEKTDGPYELIEKGQFERAKDLSDSMIKSNSKDPLGYFWKGRAIYLEQSQADEVDEAQMQEALSAMNSALELIDSDQSAISVIRHNMGHMHKSIGNTYTARNNYILALEGAEKRQDAMNDICQIEEDLKDVWMDYTNVYDYADRKFCMIVRDNEIGGCCTRGIDVFRASNVPKAFRFPIGHPYPNQLYIAHPYDVGLYVPYDQSEELFFTDKVNELCYLLECLGAETIEISVVRGKRIEDIKKEANAMGGSLNMNLISGSGQTSQNTQITNSLDSRSSKSYTIRLDPMNKPYLPEKLLWYKEQPQWQRLVERRLNNNILEYTECVQSSETRFTSVNEVTEIEGAAKYLWTKLNANVLSNVESQFKTSTDTAWNISVRFRSMKEFQDNPDSKNLVCKPVEATTEEEREYVEEFKAVLADGRISDRERRLLDRLAKSLGISSDRIAELEKLCQQISLTPDEEEYADEVKQCLADDGEITNRERRLLDRLAKSLGISLERAKEIEAGIK